MKLLKRLIQLVACLALLLLLIIAVLHWYRPNVQVAVFPAPKPVSGAAVFYNQAFAAMPNLSDEETKLLNSKLSAPLDVQAAKQLTAEYNSSLQLVAQGAMQPQCEWGLDFSKGPFLACPHFPKGLKLSQVLRLRARLRLSTGDAAGAADDILLIFRFAQHLGEPPLVIGNLVKISNDFIAVSLTTHYLQQFDAASLRKLSVGIAALPPSHPMQEALATDTKMMASYLRSILAKALAEGKEREAVLPSLPDQDAQITSDVEMITKIMRFSPTLYLVTVKNYERSGHELEELMSLPFVEARPKIDAFEKRLAKKEIIDLDIWSRLVLPGICGTRFKKVQMEGAWAIFRTALDAQLHNPNSLRAELAKLRDPYDGGPLEIRDVEGGIEVKVKGPPDKKQPTLTIGLRKK